MARKGMALILVLTMLGIVVMMTGAFMTANRNNFHSLGASMRQREVQFACQSAVSFVTYQLAHDQYFGKEPFENNQEISFNLAAPGIRVWRVEGEKMVRGYVVDEDGSSRQSAFNVTIRNNLGNFESDLQSNRIPKDSVLLEVRAESGSTVANSEVLLVGAPLYGASLTANNAIIMKARDVTFTSKDQLRNWVRSNGIIELSNFVEDGSPNQVKLETTSQGQKGVIWAKDKIMSENRELKEGWLTRANQKSGGVLSPKAPQKHDIYKLDIEDLSVGSVDDSDMAQLPGGSYTIETAIAQNFPGEDSTNPFNNGRKILKHVANDGTVTIYYDTDALPRTNGLSFAGYGPGTQIVASDANNLVKLGRGPGGEAAMHFTFDDATFTAVSNRTIHVDGGLRILSLIDERSVGNTGEAAARTQFEAKLNLRAGDSGRGAIQAEGDFELQGQLSGGGAVLTPGNISLYANSRRAEGDTQVDLEADLDLVLYGKNINIWGGNTENIRLKGLIYAQENIVVRGGTQRLTQGQSTNVQAARPLDTLELEGAVVAQAGIIDVQQAHTVNATYNEDYVKKVLKGMHTRRNGPNRHRKLEKLWVHEL